jgi:hypothetical protein
VYFKIADYEIFCVSDIDRPKASAQNGLLELYAQNLEGLVHAPRFVERRISYNVIFYAVFKLYGASLEDERNSRRYDDGPVDSPDAIFA